MRGTRFTECIGRTRESTYCLERLSYLLAEEPAKENILIEVTGPMFIGKRTFCKKLVHDICARYPSVEVNYQYIPLGSELEERDGITVYATLSPIMGKKPDIEIQLKALPPESSYELFMKNCRTAREANVTFAEFNRVVTNMLTCDPMTLVLCGEYVDSRHDVLDKGDVLQVLMYKEKFILGLYRRYAFLDEGSEYSKEIGDTAEWEKLADIISIQMDEREINKGILERIGLIKGTDPKEFGIFGAKHNGYDEVFYFTSSFKLAWMCRRKHELKDSIIEFFGEMAAKYSEKNSLPNQSKYSRSLIHILDIFFDLYGLPEGTEETVMNYITLLRTSEAFQKSQSYCCKTIQSIIRLFHDRHDLLKDDAFESMAYDGITMANMDDDVFETNRMYCICNHILNSKATSDDGGYFLRCIESMMARISMQNPRFYYDSYRFETTVRSILKNADAEIVNKTTAKRACLDYLNRLLDGSGDRFKDAEEYNNKGTKTEEVRKAAASRIIDALDHKGGSATVDVAETIKTEGGRLLSINRSEDQTMSMIQIASDGIHESRLLAKTDPFKATEKLEKLIDQCVATGDRSLTAQLYRARTAIIRIYLDTKRYDDAHKHMHIMKNQLSSSMSPKLYHMGSLYEFYGDYHLRRGNVVKAGEMYTRSEENFKRLDCCRELAIVMSKRYSLALSTCNHDVSERIGDKLRLLCKSNIGSSDALSSDKETIMKRLLGAY